MSKAFPPRRRLAFMCMLSTALVLQGCAKTIDCNDGDTKDVVLEIIATEFGKKVWYREMALAMTDKAQLSSVKTLSRDDTVKTAQCSAKYSFTYNGIEREVDVAYGLSYLEDKEDVEVAVDVNQLYGGMVALAVSSPPKKNGVEKIFNESTGALAHLITWKDGVRHGVEEFYQANGKLISSSNLVNGQKAGLEQLWTEDGVLQTELQWVDGKATGSTKVSNVAGDKLLTHLVWKDGVVNGFQSVTSNGSFSRAEDAYEYQTIKDGKKHGPYRSYQLDGSRLYLSGEGSYKDNEYDGVSRRFDTDGTVLDTYQHANGVPLQAGEAQTTDSAAVEACVKAKADAFNKQYPDTGVKYDVIDEWTVACGGKPAAEG